jgi:hypothetical protein
VIAKKEFRTITVRRGACQPFCNSEKEKFCDRKLSETVLTFLTPENKKGSFALPSDLNMLKKHD